MSVWGKPFQPIDLDTGVWLNADHDEATDEMRYSITIEGAEFQLTRNQFDTMTAQYHQAVEKGRLLEREQHKPTQPGNDPVGHPSHYTSDPSGIECIQVTRHRNFNIGNAIKYLWRAGLKDGNSNTQDLRKALWYIQDEIERLESTK